MLPKLNSSHGSETRNIINRAIEVLNAQGKTIQDLVAEGQLTEEQYAELITVINGLIKSGHVDKSDLTPEFNDEIEGFIAQLAEKAQQDEVFLKSKGININDFDDPTKNAFLEAQGIDVNYSLGVHSVHDENIDFGLHPGKLKNITIRNKSPNLLNPEEFELGGYYSASSGNWVNESSGVTISSGPVATKKGDIWTKSANSNVTFWDERLNFVSGMNTERTFEVPNDDRIAYLRTSMAGRFIPRDRWMLVKGDTIPDTFQEFSEEYILDGNYYVLENVDNNAGLLTPVTPNASRPISASVQSVEGNHDEQITHPSLIHFENGWNGYKYWMGVTPYPYGSAFHENPCIICSNDLKEWVEPSETVNPLDAVPEAERGEWFNSDTEIIYANGQLELWWRRRNNNPFSEEFYRRKSSDGVNWTEKELCFKRETSSSELSPTIIHENGLYKMWTFQAAGTMRYYESDTGTDFTFIREIEVGNVDMWHGSVRRNKEGLYEVYYSHGVRHRNYKISYAYSTDNITYSDPVEVMKSVPLRFDSELYRPTFIDVEGSRNDVRIMAYGTVSEDSEFHIAITRALTVDPTNFQGMN